MVVPLVLSFLIGIIVSAPMGPVGMLCIQRVLNQGRPAGLITGVGATLGDTLYAITALFATLGLSFIGDYIESNHTFFQISGSVILIVFGIYIYRQNPSRNIVKMARTKTPIGRLFISAFLLTISNVGVFFLFMALFSRLGLVKLSENGFFATLIILFVAGGALSWWLLVTFIVNKLRTRFNPRGLRVFNKIVGLIIFSVGIVGIITSIV